jgi:4-amino-4-deoxy-L-arabinose transferase-like glycosyltransferase
MHSLRRIFAAVALALVLAPLVASAPLFDPDEGLHAAIAQEMVRRGDYVTPTFLGEPFLDKPILFFWAEAASLRLFGDNEYAVRLPPLLFGLAGMLSVVLLGRALFGEAAGLVSGIVYGTMLLPIGVSQVAVHDIGVIPFMCAAAWCLVTVALAPSPPSLRRTLGLAAGAGACLGLSILTKGLVGVVFAGIIGACLAVYRPSAIIRLAVGLAIAMLVAAMVAAPWYVAMEHAHPGYLHYYFIERHLQGYLTASQRHAGRPFWYYGPLVLGGALPWTLYLAGAIRVARANALRLVLWGWLAVGLVFLSLGESKLVTYALPLFPAIAIIVGEHVHARDAGRPANHGLTTAALWLQIVVLALLPAAGLLALRWRYGAAPAYLWVPIGVFALLTIDAGRRARRAADEPTLLRWLAQASICSVIAMMAVLPHAAAWMTARDLARTLNAGGALPSRVSVLDERIGSLVFYFDPALRAEASRDRLDESSFSEAIARARHDPDDAVLAVRNHYLVRFNRLFPQPPVADAHAGTFTIFRALTLRETLQKGDRTR